MCLVALFCRCIGDKGEWFELTSALIYGHNKTRDGVGGSVNLFDFVTALVITRNVFQLTCVFGDFVAALVIRRNGFS